MTTDTKLTVVVRCECSEPDCSNDRDVKVPVDGKLNVTDVLDSLDPLDWVGHIDRHGKLVCTCPSCHRRQIHLERKSEPCDQF